MADIVINTGGNHISLLWILLVIVLVLAIIYFIKRI